jgi:Opacity protein and related surface antigens
LNSATAPSGALGGIFAGGNYQFGHTVIGVEGDIEAANLRGSWSDPLVGGAGNTVLKWQGSVRGRLGYAADSVLLYGTGGVAFGNLSHTYTNQLTGSPKPPRRCGPAGPPAPASNTP